MDAATPPSSSSPEPAAPGTPHSPRRDALSFLADALRTRKWARRLLSLVSVVLLLIGVGLLGYPFATNLWQSRIQSRLDRQLASPELKQAYRERRVQTGDSLTRLKMPALDVDVVVVEGTTASALRAGAGHYPQTPLPCEIGNVAVAGHRTTYGKPFANVDKLKPKDLVILETPIGACTYEVTRVWIVDKADFSVLQPTPERTLTLTSCHPKGSAKQRIIVRAEFVKNGSDPA
jgi:sortase A